MSNEAILSAERVKEIRERSPGEAPMLRVDKDAVLASHEALRAALDAKVADFYREKGIANRIIGEQSKEITKLRAECERMKAILKQANKDFGCELMDPCGTIWDHAAKVQSDNERYKKALEKYADIATWTYAFVDDDPAGIARAALNPPKQETKGDENHG